MFDIIGYAVKAVEPDNFAKNAARNTTNSMLDISVGGESITTFLNKHLEVPYDWGAGLIVYITFLSAIFMGTIILEGVDTSLMAQKTPSALNDTFINSGLLATLVGTLGRVIGDSIITFSALIDSDIFTDFVNAVSWLLCMICRDEFLSASSYCIQVKKEYEMLILSATSSYCIQVKRSTKR